MKAKLFQNKICVRRSKLHGYGVFAEKNIKQGEKIEECYMILTKGGDKRLEDYYFEVKKQYAMLTGFGCVYNHADEPNADYNINLKRNIFVFTAERNIKKDEEIFITYGDEWFSSRDIKSKKIRKKS